MSLTNLESHATGERRVTLNGIARAFERIDERAQLVLPMDVTPRQASELLVDALKELGEGELAEPAGRLGVPFDAADHANREGVPLHDVEVGP